MNDEAELDAARHKWLLEAARLGDLGVVRAVLKANPLLAKRADSRNGFTILHRAAQGGHKEIVDFVLSNVPSLAKEHDQHHCTALHWAAQTGHGGIVKLLLRKHPELAKEKDENGNTALHTAALHGQHEVVSLLLRECPDLAHEEDDRQRTADAYAGEQVARLIQKTRIRETAARRAGPRGR
jgi:ankyrin repeat protein